MNAGRISRILTVDSDALDYENGIVRLKIKGKFIEK